MNCQPIQPQLTKQPEIQELISRLSISNSKNREILYNVKDKLRVLHCYSPPLSPGQPSDMKSEVQRESSMLDTLAILVTENEKMQEFICDILDHISEVV